MQKELYISYNELNNREALSPKEQELLNKAEEAMKKAYTPYSHFNVGAAVLLANGEIFTGNNQENASYPIGLCAERVAVFAAHAQYPDVIIKTIVITASGNETVRYEPVTPCGSCRQVFAEFEHNQKQPIRIILASLEGKILVFEQSASLLPFSFSAQQLK